VRGNGAGSSAGGDAEAAQANAVHAAQAAELLGKAARQPAAGVAFSAEAVAAANTSLDGGEAMTRLHDAAGALRVAGRFPSSARRAR